MGFLISVVAFAVVTVGFLFVERLYRSAYRPDWLDREMVVMLVCVVFTGAFAGSFGAMMSTSLALPLPLWADVVVTLAAAIAIVVIARLAFRAIVGRQAPAA